MTAVKDLTEYFTHETFRETQWSGWEGQDHGLWSQTGYFTLGCHPGQLTSLPGALTGIMMRRTKLKQVALCLELRNIWYGVDTYRHHTTAIIQSLDFTGIYELHTSTLLALYTSGMLIIKQNTTSLIIYT